MKNKLYLSQIFGEEHFEKWCNGRKKVFLNFPTGMGKTTLVLDYFVPFCKRKGKKVLILCNRRLLNAQYDFDLSERYTCFSELEQDVVVMTYQQLGQMLRVKKSLKGFLAQFDVCVADECHFFYADSLFNAFDTYVLLQVLIYETFFKTVIFMTATGLEVRRLLRKVYESAKKYHDKESGGRIDTRPYLLEDFDYSQEQMMNYSHVKCCFMEDMESLSNRLAADEQKSLIFIDNKKLATDFKELLLKTGKVKEKDIFLLNAEILDKNEQHEIMQALIMSHKLEVKILITTSVLDNGVSIHDSKLGNIVLATESRVSFLQMLGRVRTENVEKCNLFIFPRNKEYYKKRVEQYCENYQKLAELESIIKKQQGIDLLYAMWTQTDEVNTMIRQFTVPMDEKWQILKSTASYAQIRGKGTVFAINEFAREKIGDMLLAEKQFLKLCCEAPEAVAKYQIGWIKKTPDELVVEKSTYKEELLIQMKKELLKIQDFDLQSFSEAKVGIAKRFQKDLFSDLNFNGTSFSNEKFMELCLRVGFEMKSSSKQGGKTLYSVYQGKVNE